MGKKSGSKGGSKKSISRVKKSNIKRDKDVKAGKLKPKSKPKFIKGGQFQKKNKFNKLNDAQMAERRAEYEDERKKQEKEMYLQMVDMMDPEDLAYLKKNPNRNKAFNIPMGDDDKKKQNGKTENKDSSDDDEDGDDLDDYERNAVKRIQHVQDNEISDNTRDLLPIRSKEGWEKRSMEVNNDSGNELSEGDEEAMETEDQELDQDENDQPDKQKSVSVIHILAKRQKLIEENKIQIGSMATNFLENPEERMFLLDRLIRYMTLGQNDSSVENTVIKLASASVLEIFKDIIPNYKISDHETQDKTVKLKKDTLKLHKYETSLLQCVKRFLVKCERIVSENKNSTALAPHAFQCMLNLLVEHPEFNYTENIIQFAVPYLNSGNEKLRQIAKSGLDQVFKNDKRGQVSYMVVRSINHHLKVKKRERVKPEMLNVLVSLKLYHLDNPKDIATAHLQALNNKTKKKREEMSKKERKMAKNRAKLDKELLEAKGEESTQTRLRFATDISNLLFAIYFRLIKNPTGGIIEAAIITNRLLLRPVLTGLAKFGHLMSIDYFQDLLRVLSDLLDRKLEDGYRYFLGNHESLLCIHTVLSILSGQGEQLTLDPHRFYNHLDRVIDNLNSNEEEITYELAAKVLREAFIHRRKKVSRNVLLHAMKRVGVASLKGGAEYFAPFLKDCIQVQPTSFSTTLLTKDDDVEIQGAGQVTVLPQNGRILDLKDPLIWEMLALTQHCNSKVRITARQIIGAATPSTKFTEAKIPSGMGYSVEKDTQGFAILSASK